MHMLNQAELYLISPDVKSVILCYLSIISAANNGKEEKLVKAVYVEVGL